MSKNYTQNIEISIIKTLAYRSIFSYPLSYHQLYNYLITPENIEKNVFDKTLEDLVETDKIKKLGNKYFLKGKNKVNWQRQKGFTKKIIKQNIVYLQIIGKIPWVKMVAITGSVSAYDTKKQDDIDIFIISSRNRVWITRLFTWLLLLILRKVPTKDGEQNKFCTNLYIDEKSMSWSKEQRNIYTANEIIMMQPIIDKDNTYIRFLRSNDWIKEYFGNLHLNKINKNSKHKYSEIKPGIIGNIVEEICYFFQKLYMKRKLTTEIVNKHFIHFNKHDHKNSILEKYEKTLKKYLDN